MPAVSLERKAEGSALGRVFQMETGIWDSTNWDPFSALGPAWVLWLSHGSDSEIQLATVNSRPGIDDDTASA